MGSWVAMPNPMPIDLAEGFHDAVARFPDWSPAVAEIEVSIDRQPFSMTAVCNFVDRFADELPEPVLDRLLSYMDYACDDLKEKLAADQTYRTGGYCLRELIKRSKETYRRLEELRRERGL
jgi:hypothetical protein